MGLPAQKGLTAKEAIDVAFDVFAELFGDKPFKNVLLEGVEYVDARDEWLVTIGFDSGRTRQTGAGGALFGQTTENIREGRVITLRASDGQFVRMKSV